MGPPKRTTGALSHPNLTRLRKQNNLWAAWRHVYGIGRSASSDVQNALKAFKSDEFANIVRINRELGNGKFDFGAARGAPLKRPGKNPRPIVIPNTEARIVQRALLDELKRLPALAHYFTSPHSFGGLVDRDREAAIREVQRQLDNGAGYYVRSDICEFFRKIPRPKALAILAAPLDPKAASLLDRATYLELDNAAALRDVVEFFPTPTLGAAQGLCLSPLMGNVVLDDFDQQMNTRGIRCVRFVDDFILLGPSERHVMKAFESALEALGKLGMTAYDPRKDTGKADAGTPSHAIDFLGCLVERGRIQPSDKARKKIVASVSEMLAISVAEFGDPSAADAKRVSLARTLYNVGNTLRGWRDSYSFCQAPDVFRSIDKKIDDLVVRYLYRFNKAFAQAPKAEARLLAGIPILATGSAKDQSRSSRPP